MYIVLCTIFCEKIFYAPVHSVPVEGIATSPLASDQLLFICIGLFISSFPIIQPPHSLPIHPHHCLSLLLCHIIFSIIHPPFFPSYHPLIPPSIIIPDFNQKRNAAHKSITQSTILPKEIHSDFPLQQFLVSQHAVAQQFSVVFSVMV